MNKIFKYIMRHKIISISTIVFIVIVSLIFVFSNGNSVSANIYTVKRGDVMSEVSVTGTVKPSQSVDLSFERSGRVTSILKNVGDFVLKGALLAKLDNSDLLSQVIQAKATLDSENTKLQTLLNGSRPEEIKAKELALSSSKEKLTGYYINSLNTIESAYSKSNDAVRNKSDALFDNDDSDSPELTYSTSDSQAKIYAQFNRLQSRTILNNWNKDIQELKKNFSNNSAMVLLKNSKSNMNTILTLLSNLQDTLINSIGLSQTTIDLYKTNINTARTNVIAEINNIDNQIQYINEQIINVSVAQNNLDLLNAGTRVEDIQMQKAKVDYANGQVSYAQAQLAKTMIYAPFSGIVTKTSVELGDVVSANQPAISIIGKGKYEIDANITESDIGRIRVGETAKVTLDAYGDDIIFNADVIKIDIGATIIEGVATYKTTLEFINNDERILPGLTANVDILNDQKNDVLYVPTRNIITKNGKKFVKLQKKDTVEEVEVETGLRGSNGNTEIIKGLNDGDIIITG